MDKSMLIGSVLGATVVTAGGAGALTYYKDASKPQYAEIVAVTAQYETIQEPRQQCHDMQVTEQAPVKDEKRIAGTVTGAIVGGLLGNQVGGGSGKKIATVAGAAAGAYAGNKTQQKIQEGNTVTRNERQCTTLMESRQILTGYEVDYRIGDETGSTLLQEKPTATRYEVRDGEPLFDAPAEEEQSEA